MEVPLTAGASQVLTGTPTLLSSYIGHFLYDSLVFFLRLFHSGSYFVEGQRLPVELRLLVFIL